MSEQAMCAGCSHWIGSHYYDINAVARCMATERGTSSSGIIGMPWETYCDCENGVSARKDRDRAERKAFDDERTKAFEELRKAAAEQLEKARTTDDSEQPKLCTTSGKPIDEHTREINPATGMQKDYIVLCPDERAKGFVRPYRDSYRHVGRRAKYPLRDLTDEEREQHGKYGYVKFEEYPESESPCTGRFWTQEDLDRRGCGAVTTMARSIAETFARDPRFYGGGFCATCRNHFPNEEFVWDGTDETVGS